ncbi:putative protein [Arabidopsis thaliana]|uniref:Uncharacterized protein F4F15.160 n=1 Tax=Arabidopsis thaliana TaxID=3702 RepID=Q9SUZ9_ARATH|nr:putative protein [Arabidopsis thaliana]
MVNVFPPLRLNALLLHDSTFSDVMTLHLYHHSRFLWRNLCFPRSVGNLCNRNCSLISPSLARSAKYYCSSVAVSEFSNEAASGSTLTSISEDVTPQSIKYPFKSEERVASTAASSNGRVMLIDGTSIIYRAYYKLLARLNHGHLAHADGNADWVLTIFSSLSLVVFDHDEPFSGVPYGTTSNSSTGYRSAKGMNFRHTLYPAYKSNRPPTPDTIVQGLQYLKASIKAMSIKVIEVRVVSPDKDFFQILSPSLRLLRLTPRGSDCVKATASCGRMASFGMEDFAKKFGNLEPAQFVDIIALAGDKSDNIPGTLENLLQSVDEIKEGKIKESLIASADQAILSKKLDNGEKLSSLLIAIADYAEGFSADPVIRRAFRLWEKLEAVP